MCIAISESMLEGIVIGVVGGTFAGLAVWIAQLLKEIVTKEIDKRKVHNWSYERTKKYKDLTVGGSNDPRWISTIKIASHTNLTPDRVRYICSIHKKIRPKMKEDFWRGESFEEEWGILEFVKILPGAT